MCSSMHVCVWLQSFILLFYFKRLYLYLYVFTCMHMYVCMQMSMCESVCVYKCVHMCLKVSLKKKCMLLYVRAWACAAGSELCGWSYLADPAQ